MKDEKTIYPTEILDQVDRKHRKKTPNYQAAWLRFFARMFDYSLLIFLKQLLPFTKNIFVSHSLFFLFFLFIPIETILIHFFSTTPGKKILGIHLSNRARKKIPWKTSFHRSFTVWVRGMGLGLFFLPFLTLLYSYFSLRAKGTTSWDVEEKTSVHFQPINRWRLFIALFTISFAFFFFKPLISA